MHMENWRKILMALLVVGGISAFWAAGILQDSWIAHYPRQADAGLGRVIPFSVHGNAIFISEMDRLKLFSLWGAALGCVAASVVFWKNDKSGK